MEEKVYIYSYKNKSGQVFHTTNLDFAKARATFYGTEHIYVQEILPQTLN